MAERIPLTATTEPSPLVAPMQVFRPMPATAGENDLHELRVRIPVDLHRQLLSLKVLRGKSLAETVSLALDLYFAKHAQQVADAESEKVETEA